MESLIELLPELVSQEDFDGFKLTLIRDQFVLYQDGLFCVRRVCDDGCEYFNGCEHVLDELQTTLVPNSRRFVGFEEDSFLVLKFIDGVDWSTFPKSLWNTEYDDYTEDERNIHYLLSDFKKQFLAWKGQKRFYGTEKEFMDSEYSKYFTIFDAYVPEHHLVSLDLSAIEPRVLTLMSGEPQYEEIFVGTPRPIYKQVEIQG